MEGKSQCVRNAVHLIIKSAFKNGEAAVFRNCTVFMKIGSRTVLLPAVPVLPLPPKRPAAAPTAAKKTPSAGCFVSTAVLLCKAMRPGSTVSGIISKTAVTAQVLPLNKDQKGAIKARPSVSPAWDRDPEAWAALVLQDSPEDSAPMFIPPLPV